MCCSLFGGGVIFEHSRLHTHLTLDAQPCLFFASFKHGGSRSRGGCKAGRLWLPFSELLHSARSQPARSPALLCMKGLLVGSQVPPESVSRRRKGGEAAFLKDTFICPLKSGQFKRCQLQCKTAREALSLPRVWSAAGREENGEPGV